MMMKTNPGKTPKNHGERADLDCGVSLSGRVVIIGLVCRFIDHGAMFRIGRRYIE